MMNKKVAGILVAAGILSVFGNIPVLAEEVQQDILMAESQAEGTSEESGTFEGEDDSENADESDQDVEESEAQLPVFKKAGWNRVGAVWYYAGSDGRALTGWIKDKNIWYYLNEEGRMLTGWQYIEENWYYMNASGAMQTGWIKLKNIWYYLNPDGAMATGWKAVKGKTYYLNENGAMLTGWQYIGENWHYMNASGAVQTGWIKLKNIWYYLNSDGAMATGWIYTGGSWYYLNENGAMLTGWILLEDEWYFLKSSGAMAASNIWNNGKYYRIGSDGVWIDTSAHSKGFDYANSSVNATAFGGYTPSEEVAKKLQSSVDVIRSKGYQVGYIMMDLNTGQGVACNPDMKEPSRSTIKAFSVAGLVSTRPDLVSSLESKMIAAVQQSSNLAYNSLYYTYGASHVAGWCRTAGVRESIGSVQYPSVTPRELAKLWTVNYDFFEGDAYGSYAAAWYENPNESVIHSQLGKYYTTRSKAGWYYESTHDNTHDAGIVYTENGPYIVAIMSTLPARFDQLADVMWAIEEAHREMTGQMQ